VLDRSVLEPLRRSLALPRWCSAAQRYSPPPSRHRTATGRQNRFVGRDLFGSEPGRFWGFRAFAHCAQTCSRRKSVLRRSVTFALSPVRCAALRCAALRCAAYSK
jgi:hypothetical protein